MYYTNDASLAGLFILLLDKESPVLRPAVRIATTVEKMEAFLPDELLTCISPSGSGSAKSKGGRPKKNPGKTNADNRTQQTELTGTDTDSSKQKTLESEDFRSDTETDAETSSRKSWKKSSYLPFLYNAYKNAHARREEMAKVLKRNPVSILLSAEKKAQSVLYRNGVPRFDKDLLEQALTDSSCIPLKDPAKREQYRHHIRFYTQTNPEKALSRAFLALLLAEECESCLDILFPAIEYTADTKASPLLYADELSRNGRIKEAKDLYQAVLNDRQSSDRSKAALRLGRLYRYHYDYETAGYDAYVLFTRSVELAPDEPLPDVLYELYLCERDGIGAVPNTETDKKAMQHLLEAAKGGCLPALREAGSMYYAGNERFHIHAEKENALEYYRAGAEKGDPACETMTGKCLEEKGLLSEARYWYFKAAKLGNIDASLRLAEFDLLTPVRPTDSAKTTAPSVPSNDVQKSTAGLCFFNAENEMAETFSASLPTGWETLPFTEFEKHLQSHITESDEIPVPSKEAEQLKNGVSAFSPSDNPCIGNEDAGNKQSKKIIVFLSDENTNRNLSDLNRAIAFLEHFPMGEPRKNELIGKIHFYLRTEDDDSVAIKMADSFNSVNELRRAMASAGDTMTPLQMIPRRNWFYRIRICNPLRDASQFLLSRLPLFLPTLSERRKQPHILILGGGSIVPKLITDILSVFPYDKDGKPLSITVLAENADTIREELEEQMPELAIPKSPLTCDLHFFSLSDHERKTLFLHGTGTDIVRKELQQILNEVNYYIVCGDSDTENIKDGSFLRSALLASTWDFEHPPIVAAYVRNNLLSRQASHFSVLGEGIGFSWYNNYNLFCFGSNSQMYTFQELEEGCLEKRAFALHRSYYGSGGSAAEQAAADYWCRFYNRDSSHMSALSSIYKAYLAGITLPETQGYGQAVFESKLAEPMEHFLEDQQHLNDAAREEHRRWVSFICSRGWRQATIAQMQAYIEQGNPRQQLYLAKLHPCITSWQRLTEVEEAYNTIQRQRNPEWKDRHFRQSDFDIVKALPELLQI